MELLSKSGIGIVSIGWDGSVWGLAWASVGMLLMKSPVGVGDDVSWMVRARSDEGS